jgi:hypothetical protein
VTERRWTANRNGYQATFDRKPPAELREVADSDGVVRTLRPIRMTVRYPSDAPADRRESARMHQAVKLMRRGRIERAFKVLEQAEPPDRRSGRPTTTQKHAFFLRLRRVTEEERLRADAERQRRPYEERKHAREHEYFDPSVERVRAAVARRLGVSLKTVSNLWNDAERGGWQLPLDKWKLRRVALVYTSPEWRGDGRMPDDWIGHNEADGLAAVEKLAFVRDGRPRRRAAEWVELAREAGYLPPSK